MNVATVLRSGGDYGPEHVYAMRRMLNRHLPDHELTCLTDMPAIPTHWAQPLMTDWPGWWAKMELFRPGLFDGPVLYLDLDTVLVGDISELAGYRGSFAMLADVLKFRRGKRVGQSGVMAWTPGDHTDKLFRGFSANPRTMIRRYRGDGEYVRGHVVHEYLQDIVPGQIVSFKGDARKGPPKGARVVCLHGRPRPHDPGAGWAHELWSGP